MKNANEVKHTPTPWIANGGAIEAGLWGEPRTLVAFMDRNNDEDREANAAFIVRAVNAHDELVAVMRDVAALLPMAARMHPADLAKLQTRVVEVLAKAEGR